jgi:cell wall-associated NlpC family hydrolase
LSSAISRSARPAVKTSAVILISGAMVASLALPASAATPVASIRTTTPVALAVAVTGVVPSAAQAPLAPRTFGNIAFTGVVKPKAKPKAVVLKRAAVTVSRSTTRSAISATSTPTQKAPVAAPSSNAGGVLGIAASLAGIYYVYGGTTTAGFDCSGYTKYVFAKVGISLPRTAEQQRQAVTTVSNPRPGDLVFIGAPAYHVGIYAGNGKMWDSPRTGKAIALRDIWSSTPTYGRP